MWLVLWLYIEDTRCGTCFCYKNRTRNVPTAAGMMPELTPGLIEFLINCQLICLLSKVLLTMLVRSIADTGQLAMAFYATYPSNMLSPPIILTIGSIVYFVSMMDVALEIWVRHERAQIFIEFNRWSECRWESSEAELNWSIGMESRTVYGI